MMNHDELRRRHDTKDALASLSFLSELMPFVNASYQDRFAAQVTLLRQSIETQDREYHAVASFDRDENARAIYWDASVYESLPLLFHRDDPKKTMTTTTTPPPLWVFHPDENDHVSIVSSATAAASSPTPLTRLRFIWLFEMEIQRYERMRMNQASAFCRDQANHSSSVMIQTVSNTIENDDHETLDHANGGPCRGGSYGLHQDKRWSYFLWRTWHDELNLMLAPSMSRRTSLARTQIEPLMPRIIFTGPDHDNEDGDHVRTMNIPTISRASWYYAALFQASRQMLPCPFHVQKGHVTITASLSRDCYRRLASFFPLEQDMLEMGGHSYWICTSLYHHDDQEEQETDMTTTKRMVVELTLGTSNDRVIDRYR